jgi:hypothetical protein
MKLSNDISPVQVKKIHIAKSQLGLSDQQYRDILSGFNNNQKLPCKTCKELNYQQAEALLNIFVKLGFKQTQNGKVKKYEEFAGRPGKFASPAQMRMIEGLWMTHSREKTEESMNRFIKRISGKDKIEFITGADAHKIIKAIETL